MVLVGICLRGFCGLEIRGRFMFGCLGSGLRIHGRLQLVNRLAEAVVIGTRHLGLEFGKRDVQVMRDVEGRDELSLILEPRCRAGQSRLTAGGLQA